MEKQNLRAERQDGDDELTRRYVGWLSGLYPGAKITVVSPDEFFAETPRPILAETRRSSKSMLKSYIARQSQTVLAS